MYSQHRRRWAVPALARACLGPWELTNQRRGAVALDTMRTIMSFHANLKQKRDRENVGPLRMYQGVCKSNDVCQAKQTGPVISTWPPESLLKIIIAVPAYTWKIQAAVTERTSPHIYRHTLTRLMLLPSGCCATRAHISTPGEKEKKDP